MLQVKAKIKLIKVTSLYILMVKFMAAIFSSHFDQSSKPHANQSS